MPVEMVWRVCLQCSQPADLQEVFCNILGEALHCWSSRNCKRQLANVLSKAVEHLHDKGSQELRQHVHDVNVLSWYGSFVRCMICAVKTAVMHVSKSVEWLDLKEYT